MMEETQGNKPASPILRKFIPRPVESEEIQEEFKVRTVQLDFSKEIEAERRIYKHYPSPEPAETLLIKPNKVSKTRKKLETVLDEEPTQPLIPFKPPSILQDHAIQVEEDIKPPPPNSELPSTSAPLQTEPQYLPAVTIPVEVMMNSSIPFFSLQEMSRLGLMYGGDMYRHPSMHPMQFDMHQEAPSLSATQYVRANTEI